MKGSILIATMSIALSLLAPSLLPAAQATRYVCTPCGMSCDAKVFTRAGTCPDCGARLVAKKTTGTPRKATATTKRRIPSPPRKAAEVPRTAPAPPKPVAEVPAKTPQNHRPKAAVLIFKGVQIIDYTGPYEVFGQAGFDVYTVAESKRPITTSMGMTVIPRFSFADAPRPDVVVVPGGVLAQPVGSPATLAWLRGKSASARHILSVCNGAFILAKAGLLDGLSATTFYGLLDDLKTAAPSATVVGDRRFVDNGRVITAAGLSSGIDGALHVLSRMLGRGPAQEVALHMEYDWRPDTGYTRAKLADRLIRDVDLGGVGQMTVLNTAGTADRWDMAVNLRSDLQPEALLEKVDGALSRAHWVKLESEWGPVPMKSVWQLTEPDGTAWNGKLRLQPDPSHDDQFTLTMNIAR